MGTRSEDRRKLLVLDINGLLLYRATDKKGKELSAVPDPPDRKVGSFFVWDRPHQQAFVEFCLQHFDVAVWSSAKAQNVEKLVSYVFGDKCGMLKFQWDQDMCDNTGRRHPDNRHRPIFHKDLKKIWSDPDLGRRYHAFNTLLIDDDKYKAELTPQNAIHPPAWTPDVKGDEDLAVGGRLQKLLEDLLGYDAVREFVSAVAKTDVAFAGAELQTRHPASMQRDTHYSAGHPDPTNGRNRQHQEYNSPYASYNSNGLPPFAPYGSDRNDRGNRMHEYGNPTPYNWRGYYPAQGANGSYPPSNGNIRPYGSARSILGEYPSHDMHGSYSARSDYRQPGWSGPNLTQVPGPYDSRRPANRDYEHRRDRDRDLPRQDEAYLNSRQNDWRGSYAKPTQPGQRDRDNRYDHWQRKN